MSLQINSPFHIFLVFYNALQLIEILSIVENTDVLRTNWKKTVYSVNFTKIIKIFKLVKKISVLDVAKRKEEINMILGNKHCLLCRLLLFQMKSL